MNIIGGNVDNGELSSYGITQVQDRWFQYYRTQGYSEQESMLLAEQICDRSCGHGNPKAGADRCRLPVGWRRQSQIEANKYLSRATLYSLSDITAAISSTRAG